MALIRICFALLALSPSFGAYAQDDTPRQLNTVPRLPDAVRPAPVPAPEQLNTTAPPADTGRRVAVPPPPRPQPVYAPTPAGQLPGGSTRPTRYQVGLKDGMLYSAYSVEQRSPLFGRSYLLLDGKQQVDFSDVGFYEDETGHYVRTTLPNSRRETTFRRDQTGRISLYSITTTQYSPAGGYGGYGRLGYGGLPYGGYRTVKTEYFSKDNGPVQDLNNRNLALATTDNAGAQQLLAQARRYQRGTIASYLVGGGLVVGGILQTIGPGGSSGISPLFFAALPVLVVPVVLQSKQAQSQKQAIALYNSGQ